MKHRISLKYGAWPLPTLAAIAVLLLAAACSGSGAKEQAVAPATQAPPATEAAPPTSAPAEKAEIPVVTIEATDDGFKVPEVVPGGIVQVDVTNTGSEPVQVSLARVKEGHTRQEVIDVNEETLKNPDKIADIFNVVALIYGVEDLAPGATNTFYTDLRTGDFGLSDDAHPDRPLVFFKADEIVGKTEPETAVSVDMVDFAYNMPDVVPGKGLWEFANTGDQWHMAVMIPHTPDASPEQMLGELDSAATGSLSPMSPGERVWVEMDFQPGEYVLVCPLPDLTAMGGDSEPMPHLLHGMQHVFTVSN